MVKDRRIFQRLDGIVNVRYAVRDRDKEKIESLPRNVGGGGIGVCLTERLQNGTVLELDIIAPDNPQKVILGVGQVQWTKPFGVIGIDQSVSLYETGIKFIVIDPISLGRIYAYFREMKRR